MPTPDNGKIASKTLNPTLNHLRGSINNQLLYAVIDPSGATGHYQTIAAAVAAGETMLYLKNGTHTISADLSLSGVSIIGESVTDTIISVGTYTITVAEGSQETTAGSVSTSNGSSTLTGVGTSFNSITNSTPFIYFDKLFATELYTIGGATTADLFSAWQGNDDDADGSSHSYSPQVVDVVNIGTRFENFTVSAANISNTNVFVVTGYNILFRNIKFIAPDTFSTFITTSATRIFSDRIFIDRCEFLYGRRGVLLNQSSCCSISHCKFFSQSSISAFLADSSNCSVTSSIFIGATNSGAILVQDVASNEERNTISNCRFAACTKGIQATSSENGTIISDCIFTLCTTCIEIALSNHVDISSCNFANYQTGISMEGSDHFAITNCSFGEMDTYHCIYISSADSGTVSNCTMSVNHTASGWSGDNAINIESSEHITVTGCTIIDFDGNGVHFETCSYCTCTGNTINGNSITAKCIEVVDCEFSTFSGNCACDATGNNIEFDSDSHYNTINGNTSTNAGADGIDVSGDQNAITGNVCRNSTGNGIEATATADRSCIVGNIALNNTAGQVTDNGSNTTSANNLVA